MLKAYVAAKTRLEDFKDYLRDLRDDESGAAMIEYALIAGLVAVAGVALLTSIGSNMIARLTDVKNALATTAPKS